MTTGIRKGSKAVIVDRQGVDIPAAAGNTADVLGVRWPRVSIRVGEYVAVVSHTQLRGVR